MDESGRMAAGRDHCDECVGGSANRREREREREKDGRGPGRRADDVKVIGDR
jgi:hypothetical protein